MTGRTTRRIAIALAVSVGFNLFLGGMITSAWITARAYEPRGDRNAGLAGPLNLRRGIAELETGSRAIVQQVRARHGDALREAGRDMRQARNAVRQALMAEEIDRAELDRALAELRRTMDAAQIEMHAALTGIATALGPDERRRFLQAALSPRRPNRDGIPERRRSN